MAKTVNDAAIKRLKLLFTVVDRSKAEFYADVLGQFEINYQLVLSGKGTANSELVDLLGLNLQKAVILSVVREDRVDAAVNCLEEKFASVRRGRGVAFAVPLSSVMGVNVYRYLSNNRMNRGEQL